MRVVLVGQANGERRHTLACRAIGCFAARSVLCGRRERRIFRHVWSFFAGRRDDWVYGSDYHGQLGRRAGTAVADQPVDAFGSRDT